MHEAEQHRHFVKRLHTLIHSQLAEDERAAQARSAVLSYAAALNEAGIAAKLFGAKDTEHSQINENLGQPDDPSTKALFEFVDEALKK